jgi:ribonuclease BN (tRNA processing enzyme)
MNPYKIENCEKINLVNPSKWTLQGHSKAGERTGFLLHPIKVLLDAGMITSSIPNAAVITHSHCDHTLNLPLIFNGRQNKVKGQEKMLGRPVYLPEACLKPIQRLMEGVIMLSDNDFDIIKYRTKIDFTKPEEIHRRQGYHPIVVKPNQIIEIPGLNNIKMEILQAYHNTESLGYGFSSIKKKLKLEFQKKSREEIIQARKNGEEINYSIIIPEVLFFCDSTIDNFSKHTEWIKYPVIICECTGFPERHTVDSMTAKYHTHLNQLEPIMKQYADKQWILVHSSSSIQQDILKKHEERLKTEGLNIKIL